MHWVLHYYYSKFLNNWCITFFWGGGGEWISQFVLNNIKITVKNMDLLWYRCKQGILILLRCYVQTWFCNSFCYTRQILKRYSIGNFIYSSHYLVNRKFPLSIIYNTNASLIMEILNFRALFGLTIKTNNGLKKSKLHNKLCNNLFHHMSRIITFKEGY